MGCLFKGLSLFYAINMQEAYKKNPIDIHIQLILTIHQCDLLSHFASEETEAQNDLFNL